MRYIDLTLPYSPGKPGVEFKQIKTVEKDGWNARLLSLYSHAGTHMDAPVHFNISPQGIDQYPPERFFSAAWVINVEHLPPKSLIGPEHLGRVKEQFRPGESLIVRTGWHKKYNTPDYRETLSRISDDLANWCVENKVNVLGVEPPSVADVNNLEEITCIHRILLKGNIIIVEGLAYLDRIKKEKVDLVVLPLKIEDGDGSPCRAIAIEN